jgi:hypothetical protein
MNTAKSKNSKTKVTLKNNKSNLKNNATSNSKSNANFNTNKSQASIRSKLLVEITNRVTTLQKQLKLRANFENKALKNTFKKIKKENTNPALSADRCMTFQNIFLESDVTTGTEKKEEGAATTTGSDGELNETEYGAFLVKIKAAPEFKG